MLPLGRWDWNDIGCCQCLKAGCCEDVWDWQEGRRLEKTGWGSSWFV